MINRATGALERCCALDQFGPMVTLTAKNCNGIGFAPVLPGGHLPPFDVERFPRVRSLMFSAIG